MTSINQSTQIKAIETSYAGCRFRSRLEARWAVFYDALGIEWQYEPEGFLVGEDEDIAYLPDFFLCKINNTGAWVEIKGPVLTADHAEWQKFAQFRGAVADRGQARAIMFMGDIPQVPGTHKTGVELGTDAGLWAACPACDTPGIWTRTPENKVLRGRCAGCGAYPLSELFSRWIWSPVLDKAYTTARSARFEHGQQGAPRPHRRQA